MSRYGSEAYTAVLQVMGGADSAACMATTDECKGRRDGRQRAMQEETRAHRRMEKSSKEPA